jgi:hypothetical protein
MNIKIVNYRFHINNEDIASWFIVILFFFISGLNSIYLLISFSYSDIFTLISLLGFPYSIFCFIVHCVNVNIIFIKNNTINECIICIQKMFICEQDKHLIVKCEQDKHLIVKCEQDKHLIVKCGHVFHENCIVEWLKYKNTCPYCRRDNIDELQIYNHKC